jgi:predicted RNA-binding protein with PUA-like domain
VGLESEPRIVRYWLMKSEPDEFGIDDLAASPRQTAPWTGVRNFTARNFMLHDMAPGDRVFFYHSSCEVPGIAGIAEVASAPRVDATQFDPKSGYYDPKSSREKPRWHHIDVKFVAKTPFVSLAELRRHRELSGMQTLARGNRLSITPVSQSEWDFISRRLMGL